MDYQLTSADEEYLSKEQFCKECHISKATALYLIKNRLIPTINKKKKTKRYLIARSDMLAYLKARELDPTLYKYQKSYSKKQIKAYSRNRATQFRRLIAQEWADLPDVLQLEEVSALLGYPKNIVRSWRKEFGLKSLTVSHTLYFPKKCLVEFVIGPDFHGFNPKSAKHMELLRMVGYV